jgi:hypothetical protein
VKIAKKITKIRKKMISKEQFLCPRSKYYGQVKPENLVFNANLQELALKIGYIANLETNGKISSEQAYLRLNALWCQFEFASRQLNIPNDSS